MIFNSPNQLLHPGVVNRPPAIPVTALYEDLEAGVRAKALIDCVQSDLEVPAQCKIELWRFDWLGELSLGNMALSMARNSMLVLVSASSDNPPPAEMERWIQAWAQTRDEHLSALVLLAAEDRHRSAAHPLYDCLQKAAQRKGVEFMCEFFDPVQPDRVPFTTRQHGEYEEVFRPSMAASRWQQGRSVTAAAFSRASGSATTQRVR